MITTGERVALVTANRWSIVIETETSLQEYAYGETVCSSQEFLLKINFSICFDDMPVFTLDGAPSAAIYDPVLFQHFIDVLNDKDPLIV